MVMSFEMDLEMVAAREGTSAMLALVALVARMQFNMSIAASLVLEGPITIIASVDGVWIVAKRTIGTAVRAERLIHQCGRRTN